MHRNRRTPALVLALALLAAPALAEDVIELDGGRVLKGQIVRTEKEWLGIETADGVVWVERKEIKTLARDASQDVAREKPPAPAPAERPATGHEGPAPAKGTEARGGAGAASVADAPRAATAPAAPAVTRDAEGRLTPEVEKLLASLDSESREERVAASKLVTETWPQWRGAIEIALGGGAGVRARVEAIRILDNDDVEDVVPLVEQAMSDRSEKVRVAAVRVARHRDMTSLRARTLELMRSDSMWIVRQEAIRALEDIGNIDCLPHVMAAWSTETDKDRRRRYRRVMAVLLGEDFGDDTGAWYRAADEVFMGKRKVREE